MSPSETPRKINISKLFLHSVRECLRFIDFKPPGLQKTCEKHAWFEVSKLKFSQLPAEFPQLASPSLVSIMKSEL